MSLSKLFNIKYLLQNLKKSRMALTLLFIIVPIFTSLMLITISDTMLEYNELGIINILAMYVIPFVLSVCLFGYVFKKNSVDFMCSMPISRKCIFITNTIGGIVIITLLQLVTLLLTLLIGTFMNGNVFAGMAADIFIYQTIAYIFVFTIANLAMSVSGNLLTQIVVTLLITFLIPFSVFFIDIYNGTHDYALYNEYGIIAGGYTRLINYTAPSLIFSGDYEFNIISIWKMIILSITYFGIGLFMFERRKMEIAGESFENIVTHLVVKSLTIAPFIALLISIVDSEEGGLISIVIAIIAIYFFIYDLITGKKIKFKNNIIALLFAMLALYGTYSAFIKIDDMSSKKIKLSSIDSIIISKNNGFEFEIEDQELIKEILLSLKSNYICNSYETKSYEATSGIDIVIKKYNGTTFNDYVYIRDSKLDELLEKYADIHFNKNAKLEQSFVNFSENEEQEFMKELEEAISSISCSELQKLQINSKQSFEIYEYKNHHCVRNYYPIEINDTIFKKWVTAYNKYAYEYLILNKKDISWFDVYFYNEDMQNDYTKYWSYGALNELYNFIELYGNDEIKDFENGILVSANGFKFYTDKTAEFIKDVYEYMEDYEDKYYEYDYYDEMSDSYSNEPEAVEVEASVQ